MAFLSGLQGAAFGPVHQQHRRPIRLTDQHGRKWFVNEDKRSGQPVGNFEAMGWSAPIYPPQHYFVRSEDEPNKFTIDYDALIAHDKDALATWERAKMRAGVKFHGQKFKETEPPSLQVLEEIGPEPTRWEIWEACRQGEPWVLGLTDVVNPKVQKFFPPERRARALDFTNPEFVPAE